MEVIEVIEEEEEEEEEEEVCGGRGVEGTGAFGHLYSGDPLKTMVTQNRVSMSHHVHEQYQGLVLYILARITRRRVVPKERILK